MYQSYSKNKFEKLVLLVALIIRIYYRVQQNPCTKSTQCQEIIKANCDCAIELMSQAEFSTYHTGATSISDQREIICFYTK